jgi:hypothetical protein
LNRSQTVASSQPLEEKPLLYTASPDGRYAVALGFTGKDIDWEGFKDADFPGTYSANGWQPDDGPPDSEYGKIVNYLVDLTTCQILGTTNATTMEPGNDTTMTNAL